LKTNIDIGTSPFSNRKYIFKWRSVVLYESRLPPDSYQEFPKIYAKRSKMNMFSYLGSWLTSRFLNVGFGCKSNPYRVKDSDISAPGQMYELKAHW